MPNIPQQQTIVQYVANVSQTQYTFAFYAPLPTDIQVYYQAPNAIPIPSSDILALNSQYTVSYNADPLTGGTITLLFTPTTGYYLTINRMVQASLNTNFSNAQNFNGANLDAALDRLLLLIQQNLNYITERNLSYVINTYLPNAIPYTQLPPLPQNYFWVGSGSGVIAAQIATVPSASVLQSMLANNAPGTDGARIVGYYDTLLSNATTVDAMLTALNTSRFSLITVQSLTVGSGTYTPTPGAKWCWARGVAGGAGGAGCSSAGLNLGGVGGGGGSGAYGECIFPAATLAYTVGAGGLAGSGGTAGTAGGNTTLGSILSLNGGNPGQPSNNNVTAGFGQAGLGGAPVTATFALTGNAGGQGWVISTTGGVSGFGANSMLGAGGIANAGGSPANGKNAPGNGYGAGGGGGLSFSNSSAIGGAGSPGIIEVYEFG